MLIKTSLNDLKKMLETAMLNGEIKSVLSLKGVNPMSLKINRQSDLDELFSKFAVVPGTEPKNTTEPKDKKAEKTTDKPAKK